MAGLRRTLSLALLALLLVLVAGPVAAAQCRMRGSCPSCPMMKAAPRSAPCHGAQGTSGMSAPMDCCQPVATPAPASALPGLETPAATLAPALPRGVVDRAPALAVAFSRAGQMHPLGLFTLHSVWRI